MARKRMIDPSIWTDEGMAELTERQQLLYIGLFSNADDDGRLKGSPAALRLILPTFYGGVPVDDVEADIEAVTKAMRQLVRYEFDGRQYIAFRNFRQWQRIDKPSPSILPPPPDESPQLPESSQSNQEPFDDSSSNVRGALPPNRKEEKLTEENRNTNTAPASAAPRRRTKNSLSFAEDSPEMRLSKRLDRQRREANPTIKPATKTQLQHWANDVRLMIEQDQRTYDDIKALIDFSQEHEFWFKNIQSMGKLRDQFSRLWAEMHPHKAGLKNQPAKPWQPPPLSWDELTPHEQAEWGSREAYEGAA